MPDYTSTTSMPAWAQPYAEGYLQRAQATADTPYQGYQGQMVAGFTPWQEQGLQAQANRALDGSPVMTAANQGLAGMINAAPQGATQNPYAPVQAGWNGSQVVPGQGGQAVQAGWNNSQVTPGQNQYAGTNNPYLSQQIDLAAGDLTRGWNQVQMPGFDRAMSQSGSFGNANIAGMAQQGASDLQRNIGQMAGTMRFNDYTTQQQLAEADLNRGMQAQQFNAGLNSENLNRELQAGQFNAGLGESAANRGMQAQQFNSQTTDSNLARQLQAGQFNSTLGNDWAGRNDSMLNQGQNRVLSALGLAPTLANQDYTDIAQLNNAGTAYQQQQQRELDANLQQFTDQRDYPQRQLDIMGNALGRSFGSTTSQTAPGSSTAATTLGGALTAAQLWALLTGGG